MCQIHASLTMLHLTCKLLHRLYSVLDVLVAVKKLFRKTPFQLTFGFCYCTESDVLAFCLF